jgi:hypothetical protein
VQRRSECSVNHQEFILHKGVSSVRIMVSLGPTGFPAQINVWGLSGVPVGNADG